jgi:hypothetical protein
MALRRYSRLKSSGTEWEILASAYAVGFTARGEYINTSERKRDICYGSKTIGLKVR